MAVKLYPPYIEGTIPAFCTNNDGTTEIVVPFSLNRAVGLGEIVGFVLKIKTVSTGTLIGTIKQLDLSYLDSRTSNMSIKFSVPETIKFIVGQYYKVQMAFIGTDGINEEVGYFSTLGVIKYTTSPKISIIGMNENLGVINTHRYSYIGVYNQKDGDVSEKMYSSHFLIISSDGNIIYKSEEVLHNSSTDTENFESFEEFIYDEELDVNKYYYIQFVVTTSNKLEKKSPRYRIMARDSIDPQLKADLKADLQFEDGHIDLYLIGHKNEKGVETVASGNFMILRMGSNKPGVWEEVKSFSLKGQRPSRLLWKDFTIEQGITYTYAIRQYNDIIYSNRIESNPIYADFEDCFLYDGERQLKIRFNPKISSFKIDVLENKSDTIGNKYPFIFRNGNVYYREFPISGLISYKMDDNYYFMSKEDIGIEVPTIDLISENIAAERKFKMAVLEWLNNGKEKIFKSSTEGNFIVRLMNISLSPNDTTGRLIHTFNCTAYETATFNHPNIQKKGFLSIEKEDTNMTKWATISLAGHDPKLDKLLKSVKSYIDAGMPATFSLEKYSRVKNYYLMDINPTKIVNFDDNDLINKSSLNIEKPANFLDYFIPVKNGYALTLTDALGELKYDYGTVNNILNYLNTIIGKITYPSGIVTTSPITSIKVEGLIPGTILDLGGTTIQIGSTGSYSATFEKEISYISLPEIDPQASLLNPQGLITYSYLGTPVSLFDQIKDISTIDIPCRQWIGEPGKLYYDTELEDWGYATDLVDIIQDSKKEIVSFSRLHFQRRPILNIFYKDKKYYQDMECNKLLTLNELEKFYIYAICNPLEPGYRYKPVRFGDYFFDAEFLQGYYVDDKGDRIKIFTGRLLDGCSESLEHPITYKDSDFFDIDPYTGDVKYTVSVTINGDIIDLSEIEHYTLKNFDTPITSITFSGGVICEASYQLRETIYSFEFQEYSDLVYSAKQFYLKLVNDLKILRENPLNFSPQQYHDIYKEKMKLVEAQYTDFIYKLDMAIKEYEEVNKK